MLQAWPIEIEDYKGQTHQIDLKPGQILHYESAKVGTRETDGPCTNSLTYFPLYALPVYM